MDTEKIEKSLQVKKDKKLELYRSIVEAQIKLNIKKQLSKIYLNSSKGFMYFLLYRNKKIKENR